MDVFTPAMLAALDEAGLRKDHHAWRLDRKELSVLIYSEKNRSEPEYGIGLYFGGPDGSLKRDGSGSVLQVGQRSLSGGRRFFYDFSRRAEVDLCERDFLRLTIPLIGRMSSPRDLISGLLRGEIVPALYRDPPGPAKAAFDIARAYRLEDVKPEIDAFIFNVSRDEQVLDDLLSTTRDWPDQFPELTELMKRIPPPIEAGRRRWPFGRK